jgi:site-specific DNA recombinase
LQSRVDELKLHLEAHDRQRQENADLAIRAFELSQSISEKWVTADIAEKRQILKIFCLNLRLDDVNLVPEIRKPSDVLAEGPIFSQSRGERI